MHAASVGEVRIAAGLVKAFKQKKPEQEFVLSVITATGLATANRELAGQATVLLAPLDAPGVVNRFIKSLRPQVLALVETELWPNLIATAAQQGVKLAIINGRLSDRNFPKYRKFRNLFRSVLTNINVACVQDETDRERFAELGVPPDRIQVCSSLKYDLSTVNSPVPCGNYREFGLEETDLVWTAGSTRYGEEEILIQAFCNLKKEFPGLKLILAPRHLERLTEIEKLLTANKIKYVRKTTLPDSPKGFDCLLLDKMGELTQAYSVSTVVFVGGSLVNFGGQNIIEPAALSKPVLFGPYMSNFKETASFLLSEKAALQVDDAADLEKQLGSLLRDPVRASQLGENARAGLRKKQGALLKNMQALEGLLSHDKTA